jgi:cephalosporin-C deacetylase-like acetyl esterase
MSGGAVVAGEELPSGEDWLRRVAAHANAPGDISFTFNALAVVPTGEEREKPLPLHQAIKDANLPEVRHLLKKLPASSLVAPSPDGYTPLHVVAAAANPTATHVDIALALINAVPEEAFAATDEEGNTPLHIACTIGALDMVRLIFAHSPEPVRVAKNFTHGATPLHLSIYQGTNAAVNAFLVSRLPPEALLITDDDRNTPLQAAREEEDTETMDLLTAYIAQHPELASPTRPPVPLESSRSESSTLPTPRKETEPLKAADIEPEATDAQIAAARDKAAVERTRKERKGAFAKAWDELIGLIIRPRRHQYSVGDLGPTKFRLHGHVYAREDVTLINARGLRLQGSWFTPVDVTGRIACVVTCHGNAGSRCFALDMIRHLLPCRISVFTFDFAGCGLSEGDYVSLGYYEKMDLEAVIQYLEGTGRVSSFGLWGRSMGAATAIMYCANHSDVTAICCDSAFASLYKVMVDLVKTRKKWVPEAAVKLATKQIRKSIKKKAQFDIKQLNTVACARRCTVPCILAHALSDDFIPPTHQQELALHYRGPFQSLLFPGDHGSSRPPEFYAAVRTFFLVHLTPDSDLAAGLTWAPTITVDPAHDTEVVRPNNLCADCSVQ